MQQFYEKTMIEKGIISKIYPDNTALVVTTKTDGACENCQLCSNLGNNEFGVRALNEIKAKLNDTVIVFIPETKQSISILLFLIPIFIFFAFYIGTQAVFQSFNMKFNELIGTLSGVLGTVIYFIALNFICKKKLSKKNMAKITKVLFTALKPDFKITK